MWRGSQLCVLENTAPGMHATMRAVFFGLADNPQKDAAAMNEKLFEKTELTYDQVAWYRQRWFVTATLVLLTPLAALILLTGKTYAEQKQVVYELKEPVTNQLLITCATLIGIALILAIPI